MCEVKVRVLLQGKQLLTQLLQAVITDSVQQAARLPITQIFTKTGHWDGRYVENARQIFSGLIRLMMAFVNYRGNCQVRVVDAYECNLDRLIRFIRNGEKLLVSIGSSN